MEKNAVQHAKKVSIKEAEKRLIEHFLIFFDRLEILWMVRGPEKKNQIEMQFLALSVL